MKPFVIAVLVMGLLPQDKQDKGEAKRGATDDAKSKAEAAQRLAFMKASLAVYEVYSGTDRKTKLALHPEPLLRWNNPVSSVPDGAVFMWTANGRPEIGMQVFIAAGTTDLWLHEFQSLSRGTFSLERDGQPVWHPHKAGVEFKPAPDAPEPAKTEVGRLQQMRAIAETFTAADDFEGKSRWELRLLSKPLHRYGKPDTEILDGALFAFVHGTDPEVWLLVEARSTDRGHAWQYALAPMTGYAVQVSRKGQAVCSCPWRKPPFDPREPFFICQYKP